MRVAGAVLCGGASRRMGSDKARLPVGGVPMAERVARVLEAAGCTPVVFVGGDEAALAAIGRRYVADRWPGEGPAGGVLTALMAFDAEESAPDAVVVAACDLPHLTPTAVGALTVALPEPVNVARTDRVEPLLACWSITSIDLLAAEFPVEQALHRLIARAGPGVRMVDVDPAALHNANHPSDLG